MFCLSFLLVTATVANPVFVFNEDDSHFFGRPAEKMTEAGLLEYLDEVTASGAVTHFFMCPNAMRANFDSKAFEPVWTAMSEPGRKPGWGPRVKLLHDRGIDPYAVWAKGCRARGVSPWLSMRMNDVHSVHDPLFCSHSTFWLKHPEFRRVPDAIVKNGGDWTKWALDYSHPEVRAYSLAFVKELLGRYDVDGIECDWMRFPEHLPPGREVEFSGCLNELVLSQCWGRTIPDAGTKSYPARLAPWRWQAGRLSSAREARRLGYGCCAPFHP